MSSALNHLTKALTCRAIGPADDGEGHYTITTSGPNLTQYLTTDDGDSGLEEIVAYDVRADTPAVYLARDDVVVSQALTAGGQKDNHSGDSSLTNHPAHGVLSECGEPIGFLILRRWRVGGRRIGRPVPTSCRSSSDPIERAGQRGPDLGFLSDTCWSPCGSGATDGPVEPRRVHLR